LANTSGITPTGYRVLIKPRQIPKYSPGGIEYPADARAQYQRSEQVGEIVELGPEAYIDKDEPWVQAGDRVFFSRYEGDIFTGEDGLDYRLVNDTAVLAHASASLRIGDLDAGKREPFDAQS